VQIKIPSPHFKIQMVQRRASRRTSRRTSRRNSRRTSRRNSRRNSRPRRFRGQLYGTSTFLRPNASKEVSIYQFLAEIESILDTHGLISDSYMRLIKRYLADNTSTPKAAAVRITWDTEFKFKSDSLPTETLEILYSYLDSLASVTGIPEYLKVEKYGATLAGKIMAMHTEFSFHARKEIIDKYFPGLVNNEAGSDLSKTVESLKDNFSTIPATHLFVQRMIENPNPDKQHTQETIFNILVRVATTM